MSVAGDIGEYSKDLERQVTSVSSEIPPSHRRDKFSVVHESHSLASHDDNLNGERAFWQDLADRILGDEYHDTGEKEAGTASRTPRRVQKKREDFEAMRARSKKNYHERYKHDPAWVFARKLKYQIDRLDPEKNERRRSTSKAWRKAKAEAKAKAKEEAKVMAQKLSRTHEDSLSEFFSIPSTNSQSSWFNKNDLLGMNPALAEQAGQWQEQGAYGWKPLRLRSDATGASKGDLDAMVQGSTSFEQLDAPPHRLDPTTQVYHSSLASGLASHDVPDVTVNSLKFTDLLRSFETTPELPQQSYEAHARWIEQGPTGQMYSQELSQEPLQG